MGSLAQDAAGALGFGSASTAANSSINWGVGAGALGASGALLQGIGGYQQAAFQASVARTNAGIETQNAEQAQTAGAYEEGVSKLKTGQAITDQKAQQAASGVDVNVGSPVAVRETTANVGALDAAMIHYNAARQSQASLTQAASYKAQAGLDKAVGYGELASGGFKAADSILGSARSIGSKYAQYQLSGAK